MQSASTLVSRIRSGRGKSGAQGKPVSSLISGMVEDSTGGVMIGAHVTLRNISDEVIASATSNSEGHFSMSEIPSGHYLLQVESGNFQAERMEVVVSPSGTGGESRIIR